MSLEKLRLLGAEYVEFPAPATVESIRTTESPIRAMQPVTGVQFINDLGPRYLRKSSGLANSPNAPAGRQAPVVPIYEIGANNR